MLARVRIEEFQHVLSTRVDEAERFERNIIEISKNRSRLEQQCNHFLSRAEDPALFLSYATKTFLLASAHFHVGGLAGLIIPLFLYVSVTGFIVANAIAGGLSVSPPHAGALSALIGATQYGTGIGGSALVGALANGTPVPMTMVIALCGIGCAASTLLR